MLPGTGPVSLAMNSTVDMVDMDLAAWASSVCFSRVHAVAKSAERALHVGKKSESRRWTTSSLIVTTPELWMIVMTPQMVHRSMEFQQQPHRVAVLYPNMTKWKKRMWRDVAAAVDAAALSVWTH